MKYFLTMKLSWSLFNKFPVGTIALIALDDRRDSASSDLCHYKRVFLFSFVFSFTPSFGRELMDQGIFLVAFSQLERMKKRTEFGHIFMAACSPRAKVPNRPCKHIPRTLWGIALQHVFTPRFSFNFRDKCFY